MTGLLFCVAALLAQTDTSALEAPTVISLEDALRIALSESPTVKVADMEIERTGYARKGTYASLFPTIDGSASFQRTIKKQVMYMDFDIGSMAGGGSPDTGTSEPSLPSGGGGIEVGRWNTWSAGVSAGMPLVNAQLWKSLRISDQDVELAVEKARSSRLETVNQVKKAFYACLLAKDAFYVYKSAYENALANLEQIQKKYNAQKASELELTRAKTTLANAIPSVYDAENAMYVCLWQLKAVMGVDLDANLDTGGELEDYVGVMQGMFENIDMSLDRNSSMKQLAIQAEQLANAVKLQQYANVPSLSLSFAYNLNAMTNDFNFSQYKWSPYSFVGVSMAIPIFAGGKRASAIKQARIQAEELSIQRENTERQLKIAIRQYLNAMENSVKSLDAAQSAVETAQKAYGIATKSYDVGRSTLTDLNDAQYALTQAQLTVSNAIYSFVTSQADLENILGADFTENDK